MFLDSISRRNIDLYTTFIMAFTMAVLSFMPVESLPESNVSDKWQHAVAFLVLVLPLSICRPHLALKVAVVALVFGAMIEILQPYFNRFSEFLDFINDGVGVVAGVFFGRFMRRFIHSIEQRLFKK